MNHLLLWGIFLLGYFLLAYIQDVRYRNTRFAIRALDKRITDRRREIQRLDQRIDQVYQELDTLARDTSHFRREIHDIHRRLKRCETALGIHEARGENVRAENLRKRQQAQASGSPLPATYTPPRATQATKKN